MLLKPARLRGLLRDDPREGLQVFMLQRSGSGAFPDLRVFPGGKVDAPDFAPHLFDAFTDAQASSALGVAQAGLRFWVAAVRECFEECGVLLVQPAAGHEAIDLEGPHIDQYRQALLDGTMSFEEVCGAQNWLINLKQLAYFSRWRTPAQAPRRFDTRFFVAAVPPDQQAEIHAAEARTATWVAPQQALDRAQTSRWQMIEPTLRSLEVLAKYDSAAQALEHVRTGHHLQPLTQDLIEQGMMPRR